MPWNDLLTILNTIDTAAGLLFLVGSFLGIRAWWRGREKTGQGVVGPTGQEDTQEDETPR